eukprot:CAMPEP_0172487248 /NCGR_PEP_ID=MMETSP1066-20121228/16236_1 /TAXON_ID=671091 /ORGANISM="Coscinodiscus wailesii, Strain CCMP2513" /LENGTH=699 /DNA_ID=CAMNT_0013253729 /DNA_START=128 /DNA_END=2230 /DNA_ORIENTATION=+
MPFHTNALFSLTVVIFLRIKVSYSSPTISLDEAILKDLLPPSSQSCTAPAFSSGSDADDTDGATSSTSHTFEHTPSPSEWNEDYLSYEPSIFLASLTHKEPRTAAATARDREWTLRFGTGGNVYSFRGVWGESVPPQHNPKAPWMDEVWQSVSVNSPKNDVKNGYHYFVHQAGVYQKDEGYTSVTPFHCPSIASYCGGGECSFGSWGQQAAVPTTFHSDVLYFNRYRDCGDGVIEMTSVVYNDGAKDGGDDLTYINIPWGGVRTSSLKNVLLSRPDGSSYQLFPPQMFGNARVKPLLKNTGGYTIFAQNLEMPKGVYFRMPTATDPGGVDYETSEEETLGNDDEGGNETTCDTGDGNANVKTASEEEPPLVLQVRRNNTAFAPPHHCEKNGKYTVRIQLKDAITVNSGIKDVPLYLVNSRTNERVLVSDVMTWAWQGGHIFFCPVDATVDDINKIFLADDIIRVELYDEGKKERLNTALSHVHGVDKEHTEKQRKEFRVPTLLRVGLTNKKRDYTVYTVNYRGKIKPKQMYSFRQYFITDKLSGLDKRSVEWVSEVKQEIIEHADFSGRVVTLVTKDDDTDTFGALVAGDDDDDDDCGTSTSVVCTGLTTPGDELEPLFYMTCGEDKKYVGSNRYYFSPEPQDDVMRSYVCDGEEFSVRPTWKLLGFFEEGACDGLKEGRRYDADFCKADVAVDVRDEL